MFLSFFSISSGREAQRDREHRADPHLLKAPVRGAAVAAHAAPAAVPQGAHEGLQDGGEEENFFFVVEIYFFPRKL